MLDATDQKSTNQLLFLNARNRFSSNELRNLPHLKSTFILFECTI